MILLRKGKWLVFSHNFKYNFVISFKYANRFLNPPQSFLREKAKIDQRHRKIFVENRKYDYHKNKPQVFLFICGKTLLGSETIS